MLLLVTGLPSPRKTRFVDALVRRLGSSHVIVGSLPGAHAGAVLLHVHAETDVEALLEGTPLPDQTARCADLVVRVDWEPLADCVDRVVDALRLRTALGA